MTVWETWDYIGWHSFCKFFTLVKCTFGIVRATISDGLNGWSEALTAGLAFWTAKTSETGKL